MLIVTKIAEHPVYRREKADVVMDLPAVSYTHLNPQAVISRDTSGQEVAEFSGTTNIEGVPSTWKVTETYDHTAGVTLGDNSVIRTLSVDLR